MKDYWTTVNGKQISYQELEDSHLQNIINDGYRNPKIIKEAERRGFEVPNRKVDQLSFTEWYTYLEAMASCALSGNELAQTFMDNWNAGNVEKAKLLLNIVLEGENK
jgi:hypothetical protein